MPELSAPLRAGPPVVAVLDDDKPLSLAVCRVFQACGLGADAYHCGRSFMEAVDRQRYDAFVLDWCLTGETAKDVIRGLRRTRYALSPIFLYTGQFALSDARVEREIAETLAVYRVHFRHKPYSHRAMASEISQALQSLGFCSNEQR